MKRFFLVVLCVFASWWSCMDSERDFYLEESFLIKETLTRSEVVCDLCNSMNKIYNEFANVVSYEIFITADIEGDSCEHIIKQDFSAKISDELVNQADIITFDAAIIKKGAGGSISHFDDICPNEALFRDYYGDGETLFISLSRILAAIDYVVRDAITYAIMHKAECPKCCDNPELPTDLPGPQQDTSCVIPFSMEDYSMVAYEPDNIFIHRLYEFIPWWVEDLNSNLLKICYVINQEDAIDASGLMDDYGNIYLTNCYSLYTYLRNKYGEPELVSHTNDLLMNEGLILSKLSVDNGEGYPEQIAYIVKYSEILPDRIAIPEGQYYFWPF